MAELIWGSSNCITNILQDFVSIQLAISYAKRKISSKKTLDGKNAIGYFRSNCPGLREAALAKWAAVSEANKLLLEG